MQEYAIDFKCCNGKRFVWGKKSYDKHASRREELKIPNFTDRIKRCCCDPDCLIQSHVDKCLCYYYKEYTIGNSARYTKVIVDEGSNINTIRTAYRPDSIKELKYHKPLWTK